MSFGIATKEATFVFMKVLKLEDEVTMLLAVKQILANTFFIFPTSLNIPDKDI